MSIQSEINRISSAKADILAALTEKGVDTSGAGLTDIAGLIAGIEAGGGGGDDTYRIAKGTFTLTSGTTSYNLFTADELKEITGRRVQYFLMIDGFSADDSGYNGTFAYAASTGYIDLISSVICTSDSPPYYMTRNNSGSLMSTISQKVFTSNSTSGITLTAKSGSGFGGQTYKWIMLMIDS